MTKTVFVIYEDEILTDTGGRTDLKTRKIGEYLTKEEAQSVYRAILNDKPEDVDIEIRIEQEEKEVTENERLFALETQIGQLAKLISNQVTIYENVLSRLRKLEKVAN